MRAGHGPDDETTAEEPTSEEGVAAAGGGKAEASMPASAPNWSEGCALPAASGPAVSPRRAEREVEVAGVAAAGEDSSAVEHRGIW